MKTLYAVGVGVGIIAGIAALLLYGGNIASLASVIASQNSNKYAACIRTFSEASHNNFITREVELNGDGQTDAFVQHKDGSSCGTAGCVYEICASTPNHTYTHIPFGYAAHTIKVKETKTNDMYDLILNDDKDLTMAWDGTQYMLQE